MALICPPPHVGGYGILGSYFHGSNFNLLFSHFVLRDDWSRRCAKPFTHFSRYGSNGLSLCEWPPRRLIMHRIRLTRFRHIVAASRSLAFFHISERTQCRSLP